MKNTKRNKINIIFSSFLVIGYIVCTYFFSSLATQVSGTLGTLIQVLMLVIFGLLLFYATRVGEGKQIKRFSLAVLLLIDLPALYIILAAMISSFPFHDAIAPQTTIALMGGIGTPSIILMMACVALGYGIPYTFFAGYEIKEEDEEPAAAENAVVEGGLVEELAADEADSANDDVAAVDETTEETTETTEETAETTEETAETTEETAEPTEAAAEEAVDAINETEE